MLITPVSRTSRSKRVGREQTAGSLCKKHKGFTLDPKTHKCVRGSYLKETHLCS